MKKLKIIVTILVPMLMSLNSISYACTSFAVFSSNNLYGMNFDYPDTDIRFVIHKTKAGKTFSLEFKEGNCRMCKRI